MLLIPCPGDRVGRTRWTVGSLDFWSRWTCGLTLSACPAAHWHVLHLEACHQLEFIEIEIFFRAPCGQPQPQNIPALSLAGAGMLSQASGTLRKVSIIIWDLPRTSTLSNKGTLRLQAFDKVVTADRFPIIKEVRVAVMPQRALYDSAGYEWLKAVAAVRKAMPSLHSRGLLDVTWTPQRRDVHPWCVTTHHYIVLWK